MSFFLSISNHKLRDPGFFVQLACTFLPQVADVERSWSREEKVGRNGDHAMLMKNVPCSTLPLALPCHNFAGVSDSPSPTATRPHGEFSEMSRNAIRCAMDVPSHCTFVGGVAGGSNNRFDSSSWLCSSVGSQNAFPVALSEHVSAPFEKKQIPSICGGPNMCVHLFLRPD